MVDTEVENTLREIRERVRAEAQAQSRQQAHSIVARAAASEDSITMQEAGGKASSFGTEALARLEANLATTERAWNRLPPLSSNRSGFVARLELWIKRQIKRASHWYTWEQVNFNAAAHHALRDTLSALRSYEQRLAQQHALMQSALESERAERARVDGRLEGLETQLREAVESLQQNTLALRDEYRAAVESLQRNTQALRDEQREAVESLQQNTLALRDEYRAAVESLQRNTQALRDEQRETVESLRHNLQDEQRERIEHLLEEQRVSFRQLSLGASETAVMHDRARRDTEARLAELARRIGEIKAATSDD